LYENGGVQPVKVSIWWVGRSRDKALALMGGERIVFEPRPVALSFLHSTSIEAIRDGRFVCSS